MIDSTVLIKARFYQMHSCKPLTSDFKIHSDIRCINLVMVFTKLSIQILVLNILWTFQKRLANAPTFRNTNRHVRMELQLANTPLLTLLRSSQYTTSSECIEILILGSCDLFQFKILSLILISILQSFESNVVGRNQSECEREQIKGSLRPIVLVGRRPAMINRLAEVNQHEMDGDSELETVRFIHHQIQYHQYKIDGSGGSGDETGRLRIHYQTA